MTMPTSRDIFTDLYSSISEMRKKQLSYLTAEQAKQYGFDLDPGWAVKVDWDGDMPKYTYVSPEKWEFSDFVYGDAGEILDYTAISPEGARYQQEDIEQQQAEIERQQEEYQEFVTRLEPYRTEGGYDIAAALQEIPAEELTKYFGADIFQIATQTERWQEFVDTYRKVFPSTYHAEYEAPFAITQLYEEIPESAIRAEVSSLQTDEGLQAFLTKLRNRGWNENTEALLRMLIGEEATLDVIGEFFTGIPNYSEFPKNLTAALPNVARSGYEPALHEWAVDYFQNDMLGLRRSLIFEGRNESTERLVRQIYPDITEQQMKNYFDIEMLAIEQEAARGGKGITGTFTAGVGDLVANTGGALKWLGAEGVGDRLTKIGLFMQVQAAPLPFEPEDFTWKQLFNPAFYTTYGVRMLPTLMFFAVPAVGAYGLAGSVAGRVGLGGVAKAILAGAGAATISRPIEAALEAGAAYDEAIAKGLSPAEAEKVAQKV